MTLRNNKEIQKKKIIASAVLFLSIVPLKMGLEMIFYYYRLKLVHSMGKALFWDVFFLIAISLYTDFVPYFVSTTIINSNIIKVEEKLKASLTVCSIILGTILLYSIIITIIPILPGSSGIFQPFYANSIIYGIFGIVMSFFYIVLIVKWRRKINTKS